MRKIRCFLAVPLEASVKSAVNELIGKLAPFGQGVRWVEPESYHLTLKFFGEIGENETYDICKATRRITQNYDPFMITLAGADAFPDVQRPRTVWVGLTEGREQLCELQDEIEAALRDLGYKSESRQFKPHLTIGRVRDKLGHIELPTAIKERKDHELGSSSVAQVVLFSSELRKSGPEYTKIGTSRLGAES